MIKHFMKSHFSFNRRQRNGIFFLALIVIALQLLYHLVDFSRNAGLNDHDENFLAFQEEVDSLKRIELENRKPKLYLFNPNYISDHKGYQLGMQVEEIDRLLLYRKSGKFINSSKQFQEITKVSDSLLTVISPYFKFPVWKSKMGKATTEINSPSSEYKKISFKDLNLVAENELIKIRGIGKKLALRIVNYRSKLGGFTFEDQLYEVYYLDKEVADKVLALYKVFSPPVLQKLDINSASFKEVLSLVYLDYELTKKIFDYKREVAEIQSIEELKKIDGFPMEKFDRIALYLMAK